MQTITTVQQAETRLRELWDGPHTAAGGVEYYAILDKWSDSLKELQRSRELELNEMCRPDTIQQELEELELA